MPGPGTGSGTARRSDQVADVSIIAEIGKAHAELTAWRRDLHAHPELAFEEMRTADIVTQRLAAFGIEVHRGLAKTGVVGTLRKGSGTRRLGLRADMDALPLEEKNDFGHRSRHRGRMHACGHDGHTTMLLGAAQYLARHGNFDGTIHFIFQPAEEAAGGARVMIEDGLFEKFPVDAVFGMHNWPRVPAGHIQTRSGPVMASFDMFDIEIHGVGSHAAYPQLGRDPVVAAGELIGALQGIVSRNVDPLQPAVLSVTRLRAGDAYNIIPDSAHLAGGVRCFSPELREEIAARMQAVVDGVCTAQGLRGKLDYRRTYPCLVNTPAETGLALRVADETVGAARVHEAPLELPSEDFAFMLEKRPGCYLFLGNGEGEGGCLLHNPRYDFNDEILPVGASFWARLAEAFLPARGAAQARG